MTNAAEIKKEMKRLSAMRGMYGGNGVVPDSIVTAFDQARARLEALCCEDFSLYTPRNLGSYGTGSVFVSALYPAIDQILIAASEALKIEQSGGDPKGLIADHELASRCLSLLDEKDHFDRVINQATQVLEVRLRTRSCYAGPETGANLVSKILNNDPQKALLRVSDVPAEQEGFANLCRGVMQYLRNSSHHSFKPVTPEDATKVCVLVDYLLGQIGAAKELDATSGGGAARNG